MNEKCTLKAGQRLLISSIALAAFFLIVDAKFRSEKYSKFVEMYGWWMPIMPDGFVTCVTTRKKLVSPVTAWSLVTSADPGSLLLDHNTAKRSIIQAAADRGGGGGEALTGWYPSLDIFCKVTKAFSFPVL
jgi:hypothetical protein